jgi:hypothetical protein
MPVGEDSGVRVPAAEAGSEFVAVPGEFVVAVAAAVVDVIPPIAAACSIAPIKLLGATAPCS